MSELKEDRLNPIGREDLTRCVRERWENFLARGQAIRFSPGQTLFYAGHQPLGIYLLCAGTLDLQNENGDSQSIIVLAAEQHLVIGIDFLIADLTYPYTAKALDEVHVVFITRTDFFELISNKNPSAQNRRLS